MTHTFAIWHSGRPLSNSEAAKVCKKICDGEPAGLLPHAEIEAFYAALTAQHPEIKNIDPDLFDPCERYPWCAVFEKTNCHIVLICTASKSSYILRLLLNISSRHGLSVFDQKANQLFSSGAAVKNPWWRFW